MHCHKNKFRNNKNKRKTIKLIIIYLVAKTASLIQMVTVTLCTIQRAFIHSYTLIQLLTFTENLCHTWPRIFPICRTHNPFLTLFLIFSKLGATAYPSGAHQLSTSFCGFVLLNLQFQCVVFCRSLFDVLSLCQWRLYCMYFLYLLLLINHIWYLHNLFKHILKWTANNDRNSERH